MATAPPPNFKAPYSKENPWWEDKTYRCWCKGCSGPDTCRCCLGEKFRTYDADEDGIPSA